MANCLEISTALGGTESCCGWLQARFPASSTDVLVVGAGDGERSWVHLFLKVVFLPRGFKGCLLQVFKNQISNNIPLKLQVVALVALYTCFCQGGISMVDMAGFGRDEQESSTQFHWLLRQKEKHQAALSSSWF